MAIPVTSLGEIRSSATANNVNAGWFNPEATFGITDATATSATGTSPVISSATYTFVAGDDEAWVYVKSGTNWTPGFYQIASVSGGAATLRAAIGEAVQFNAVTGEWGPNTVAGCATTASPTGGTIGVDYTQQDAAILTATDLVTDAAGTTVTSAGAGFRLSMVGNGLHITAGTNWTTGWYMITSFNSTSSVVIDRDSSATGSPTGGTFFVGGAMSMNSTLDDDFLETSTATNGTGSCRIFVRQGTITLGESISLAAAGGTQAPIRVIGYASIRGDNPKGSTRPTIECGVQSIVLATAWYLYYLQITGTAVSVLQGNTNCKLLHVKITNSSTTAGRNAITTGGNDLMMSACEFISYRGRAINLSQNVTVVIHSCFLHSSDILINTGTTTATTTVLDTIFESPVTAAFSSSAAVTGRVVLYNCTFFGASNTKGTAVVLATGTTEVTIQNCIFAGWVTAISHADVQTIGDGEYNDYFNNDTDVSNWLKGPNSIAVDPAFTNVGQVTGTAGAFTAGNDRLVDTSKNFTSLGVVGGDHIHIISGTGATAGYYGITSITTTTNPNDTLLLTPAPGTNVTADKVYEITTGHNYLPTGAI